MTCYEQKHNRRTNANVPVTEREGVGVNLRKTPTTFVHVRAKRVTAG
jgi:hypothetical protein